MARKGRFGASPAGAADDEGLAELRGRTIPERLRDDDVTASEARLHGGTGGGVVAGLRRSAGVTSTGRRRTVTGATPGA
jgi:hypothetical protein